MDRHNEEHAVDRDRLLSCQIKWQRGWLLETHNKQTLLIRVLLRLSPWARKGEVHFDTRSERIATSLFNFHPQTPRCARSVFICLWTREGYILCFSARTFLLGGMRVGWMLSIHILCHNILHLRWQTLWLHIIWVISLYFYAADVSPCQQAPWQSKMENPPLLKCCTWVSLLSFPSLCPHQLWGSHGTLSRVQSWWWENIF